MSLAPTWLSGEGWRAADSGIDGLFTAELGLDIARRSEAAHLDFVFRPDTSFLMVEPLEQSFGFASLDPTLQMAALVHETSKIGLVTTVSTTFSHPYTIARQIMSLHWMSRGRAGWNMVTALQGNRNFGLTQMPSSEDRYVRAWEFTEVVEKLWRSFPAEALLADRDTGRYADTDLVLPIDHQGPAFEVEGPLNIPEFPGARIPSMQAGGSAVGIDYAARSADMVFGLTPDMESALSMRAQLSERARAHGRAPRDVRFLPGLNLYLGDTRAQAYDVFMATHARVDRAQRIERLQRATGLDLANWPGDGRITGADLAVAGRGGQYAKLLQLIETEGPTLNDLLTRPELLAAIHWQVIGTPDDALHEITRWFESGAIDGFVAVPGGSARSMHLTLEELVPRLARAGLYRKAYLGSTLAAHLDD
tara:strand:+ start:6099 stop:7361 length:1263 start_codon:yes stop_codon:yes gene_type:complete